MITVALQPNDILLYRPKGAFGWLISTKTWHKVSHVEVYEGLTTGARWSLASRDGIGVDRYPTRLTELAYVLRPTRPLNRDAGLAYFNRMRGTKYGWLDLLNFVGIKLDASGIVCSPFVAGYLRAEGWDVFPEDPIVKVSPFQFLDLIGSDCQVAYDLSGNKDDVAAVERSWVG